ncbi:MAG: AAA family ATPase [Candidatus Campbellbacteria bacterium]|nr:AAA family ATPase [Candidatus Campbellbacteria bacterium]
MKDQRVWNAKYNFEGTLEHKDYLVNSNMDRSSIDNKLSQLLAKIEETRKLNKNLQIFLEKFLKILVIGVEKSYAKAGDVISYKISDGEYFDIDMSLGSGLLNLFRIIAAIYFDKKIIVIDEPEVFLHPSAQIKLSELLFEESKK